MSETYTITHYTENGKDIFGNWVKTLKDKKAQSAIYKCIDRMAEGHLGEHKLCRDGV